MNLPERKPRFAAVLFDVGGTLWTADGPSRVREAAHRLGASVTVTAASELWDEIAAASRTAEELAKQRDLSPEAHRRCWLDLLTPADAIAPGMSGLLYEDEFRPESFVLYPDAPATLGELRRMGLRLGIVSDVGHDIRGHLAHHGLLNYFDACVLSYEHGAVKPDPRLFWAACAELSVDPEQCLMVGDSPGADGGAIGAGLTALVLPPALPGRPRGLGITVALAASSLAEPSAVPVGDGRTMAG